MGLTSSNARKAEPGSVIAPAENILERLVKDPRNAKGYLKAGRIFALFDRGDRLSGNTDTVAKIALSHLGGKETQRPYVIVERELRHDQ